VAFELTPNPGDPGEPQVRIGRVGGAELGEERRLVRDGAQVLAHGALICPNCTFPIAPDRRIGATSELRCGFCDHAGQAREFVREDVFDTLGNEVYVVARIA
jgi:hypothetical protein